MESTESRAVNLTVARLAIAGVIIQFLCVLIQLVSDRLACDFASNRRVDDLEKRHAEGQMEHDQSTEQLQRQVSVLQAALTNPPEQRRDSVTNPRHRLDDPSFPMLTPSKVRPQFNLNLPLATLFVICVFGWIATLVWFTKQNVGPMLARKVSWFMALCMPIRKALNGRINRSSQRSPPNKVTTDDVTSHKSLDESRNNEP